MNITEIWLSWGIPLARRHAGDSNRFSKVFAIAAAIALFGGGGVKAQVTGADAACRKMIQKQTSKLSSLGMKVVQKCIHDSLSGKIPADTVCSEPFDEKGRVDAAYEKLLTDVPKKCLTVPVSYPNCPSPASYIDSGGATSGVDTSAELADCQATLNLLTVETLYNYILRPDGIAVAASPKRAALAKCANAIGKGAAKLWKKVSKARGKCQTTSDAAGGPYEYYLCSSADPKLKIAASTDKLINAVMKDCGTATGLTQGDLALLHSCASNATGIAVCVATAVKRNAGGMTAAAFEFAGVCPSSVRVVVNGGGRNGQRNSSTRLDLGWTGLGHDQDLFDGFTGRLNVSCSSDDCSSCTITVSCAEGNCRCSNDPTIVCSAPFVAGGPCGANTCIPHLGPPLPLSASNAPTCTVNTVQTPFSGTADLGTGDWTLPISGNARVYLGISPTRPCPTCSGAGIGVPGTCSGGSRNGLSCTTNAINTTFGNTSYDCPPTLGANISGSGLKIGLSLDDGPAFLPASDPCDMLLGYSCFGGACSLDPTRACQVDTDCSGVGLGTCSDAGGTPRQPNGCDDLTCNSLPSELGTCNQGAVSFCDGILGTQGVPYLTCFSDAGCTSIDPAAGSCSITMQRPCFVDPIVSYGLAGTDGAEWATTFGSGPTTSGGVNGAYGLAGPGRLRLDVTLTPLCSDGATLYEPGGANCP